VTERFFLTDTHPLIWYITDQQSRLTKKVRAAFEQAERGDGSFIWIPAASLWELSLLLRKTQRFEMVASFEELVADRFYSKSIAILDLQTEDIMRAHALAFNKDPFDALIVATAQRTALPLITADNEIHDADICQVYWD
jgi:PIN domain nuclease of toxin-antitoxin system